MELPKCAGDGVGLVDVRVMVPVQVEGLERAAGLDDGTQDDTGAVERLGLGVRIAMEVEIGTEGLDSVVGQAGRPGHIDIVSAEV